MGRGPVTGLPAGLDDRFGWPLFSDIVDVLEDHGYRGTSEPDGGAAIDALADLVRAYEGQPAAGHGPERPAGPCRLSGRVSSCRRRAGPWTPGKPAG
jgi:hypothetical protein